MVHRAYLLRKRVVCPKRFHFRDGSVHVSYTRKSYNMRTSHVQGCKGALNWRHYAPLIVSSLALQRFLQGITLRLSAYLQSPVP